MTLRRTGLKPGKPLKSGGPLRRFTELRRTPRSIPGTSGGGGSAASSTSPIKRTVGSGLRPTRHRMPVDVAAVVKARSGGWCEIAAEGCWGTARELHHRVSQKLGGRHRAGRARIDRPSNVLHACRSCHLAVTDHPRWAYLHGWSLRERQDSAMEPVLYRGDLVYLDDAGQKYRFEEVGA
jgi:hypothetical protein